MLHIEISILYILTCLHNQHCIQCWLCEQTDTYSISQRAQYNTKIQYSCTPVTSMKKNWEF